MGFEKVDVVGYLQGGGILLNVYIKMYGGVFKVDKLIGLVVVNYGIIVVGFYKFVDGLFEVVKDFFSMWSYDYNMEVYGQQFKGLVLM